VPNKPLIATMLTDYIFIIGVTFAAFSGGALGVIFFN